jgi:hypothetical protein
VEEIHDYDNACERYLLGELSEQEQMQFEEAYFADDALFERFRAIKDDLVDAYTRGDLPGQKRERFEQHFLATNPRRQRVEEAKKFIRTVTAHATNASTVTTPISAHMVAPRSLWRSISERFARRPLVWQGALAVLIIVTLAGSWLLVRRFQNGQLAVVPPMNENRSALAVNKDPEVNGNGPPVNSTTVPADRSPQPKDGNKYSPQPMPAQVASLLLSPFSPRDGASSNSLMLHPDTSTVRLRLALKEVDYIRYDVVLRTLDGEQVLHRQGIKPRSSAAEKSVTITLNPSVLRRQDYIMTLSGFTADGTLEAIGDYYFRVERTSPQSTSTPSQK